MVTMEQINTNKRREPRIPVGIPATVALLEEAVNENSVTTRNIYIRDISSRGAKLALDDEISSKVEIDTRLRIKVSLLPGKPESEFKASVRWLREEKDGFIAGVEYFDLDENNKPQLDYFISGPIASALDVNGKNSGRYKKREQRKKQKIALWIVSAIIIGTALAISFAYLFDYLGEEKSEGKKSKSLNSVEEIIIDKITKSRSGQETIEEMKKKYKDYQDSQ